MHFRVHGYVPGCSMGSLPGRRVHRGMAHHIWGPLADSLRGYLGS